MGDPWTTEQVLALAPDASSVTAGRKLAVLGSWSGLGASTAPAAVWGLCQGSGKTPYQTVVDVSGPAYRCSCPSRKFPCKHALGLLLLWSTGALTSSEPAPFAAEWLATRAQKGARTAGGPLAGGASRPTTTADPAAAARRADHRHATMGAGLADLTQWLVDQVRAGLASTSRSGYGHFDAMAARMVDAQCPEVAARLRALPGIVASGEGWHERLLSEYASLYLLATAYQGIEGLSPELATTVRTRAGQPPPKEQVLAGPAVRDRWNVLAVRDRALDRLTERRCWLVGRDTGRAAVVVSFAPLGGALDASLVLGTSVDADVHFYPGAVQVRALVSTRYGSTADPTSVVGASVLSAADAFSDAVAADPWVTSMPVLLRDVRAARHGGRWALRDAAAAALPVVPDQYLWKLVALTVGDPVSVLGEWTADGLVPLSVLGPDGLVAL